MSISLEVPPSVLEDQELPELKLALDAEIARKEFKRRLPRLSGEGRLRLHSIRVTRHKPGRRCVVEYDVEISNGHHAGERVTLVGKIRARRSGNEGFRLQEAIWNAGFQGDSGDRISVPEPVGVISRFRMWFQRKVEGQTIDRLLCTPEGPGWARKVAEAAHKLHQSAVPTLKKHNLQDELKILQECFEIVQSLRPAWADRVNRLMAACRRRAEQTQVSGRCGIHRDYYASQVIVGVQRLWVIDFDLYCEGDPALDIGNFIGHTTEQALRETGRADALAEVENSLAERFIELSASPELTRASVRLYADLTLARHIFLSLKLPGREQLGPELLRLCEQRFGLP